jgi:hypothetical protein
LYKRAADFGKIESGGFGDFAGRGDGISVISAAAGEHCAFYNGNVAFTELAHVHLQHVLEPPAWEAE